MSKGLIIFLGIFSLLMLGNFYIYKQWPVIQNDIDTRVHAELAQNGLEHVIINTDGRDIVLKGEVTSDMLRQQAEEYARNIDGVNTVNNQLTLAAADLMIVPEVDNPDLENSNPENQERLSQ